MDEHEEDALMATDDRERLIAHLTELAGDPTRWATADSDELCQAAFFGLMHYGAANDPEEVTQLVPLYNAVVERTAVEERIELLQQVTSAVEQQAVSGNALMPFLIVDPAHQIVSTAALNLAVLTPGDDPLTGPREVLRIAVDHVDDTRQNTRTSILAGLMLLGDRRVLEMLGPCWELVDAEHRHDLARATSGYIYAAVVDYYLDWLDACLKAGDGSLFGNVAAQLARMPMKEAGARKVFEMERIMPTWLAPDGVPIRYKQTWGINEFARLIEPRFRDLLARETEPKVLPMVMQMWGLSA